MRVIGLEAEATLAAHQTGHNGGVIHSGLYTDRSGGSPWWATNAPFTQGR